MTARGRFITVEGQDGSGKTTNLSVITGLLHDAAIPFVETREPGGTALGEEVRKLVLHRHDLHIDTATELLLIFAARAQHIATVIEPALARGEWVVCDRFTDATYAYQGGGRGFDEEKIRQLEIWVQAGLRPDLTILFDVDVEIGALRAVERSDADRFESEATAFKQSVRQRYLKLAAQNSGRIVIIDANKDLPAVRDAIRAAVGDFIAKNA